jgi:nucleoside-diphosphate-sugar epimerase
LLGRPPGIVNLDKAREGFAGSWTCSGEKARQQLGFAAAAALDERMRQTAQWYQEQGWL